MEIVKESCWKKQGQYGLVIYGLSSIHDAKINNNIESLKTQQYYLIRTFDCCQTSVKSEGYIQKKRTTRITRTGLSKNNVNECWFWTKAKP